MEELVVLIEIKLKAQQNLEIYWARMSKALKSISSTNIIHFCRWNYRTLCSL